MDTKKLIGFRGEQHGMLRQNIKALMDDELIFEKQRQDELLERLRIKHGKSKEELCYLIESLSGRRLIVL